MEPRTGPKIDRLLDESSGLVIVVTPYITRKAFRHLLAKLNDRPVVVVTDWDLHAVAAGATDPRVFLDVNARQAKSQLKLLPSLHGKLYWTDSDALVGSTNLTGNGTGWFGQGNLELLVNVAPDDDDVDAFLQAVMRYSYHATSAEMDSVVAAAKAVQPVTAPPTDTEQHPMLLSFADSFVEEYETGELFTTEATRDAKTLRVPHGLSRHDLVTHLRAQLLALPYFRLTEQVAEQTGNANDPAVQRDALLEFCGAYNVETPDTPESADRFWEVLMNWMGTIFADQFTPRVTGPTVLARNAGHF